MGVVLTFPTTSSRGVQRPASLEIERQPLAHAADWQAAIAQECRRHRTLTPVVHTFLKSAGLLGQCVFLASDEPDGPLRFRFIGTPTVAVLGRAWARANLGQPHIRNPHAAFPLALEAEYAEAIDSDECVLNAISLEGFGTTPQAYTHLLAGWRAPDGRRAVLSAVALH